MFSVLLMSNLSGWNSCLEPDVEEEEDSYSAPFYVRKLNEFVNSDNPEMFFTTGEVSFSFSVR